MKENFAFVTKKAYKAVKGKNPNLFDYINILAHNVFMFVCYGRKYTFDSISELQKYTDVGYFSNVNRIVLNDIKIDEITPIGSKPNLAYKVRLYDPDGISNIDATAYTNEYHSIKKEYLDSLLLSDINSRAQVVLNCLTGYSDKTFALIHYRKHDSGDGNHKTSNPIPLSDISFDDIINSFHPVKEKQPTY